MDYPVEYEDPTMGNLLKRQGDRTGAERMFQEATRLNPLKPEAYLNLGALLTNRGAYNEAIPNYKKAIELDPGQRTAYINLALTYERMGDPVRAEQYRRLAERLNRPSAGYENSEPIP